MGRQVFHGRFVEAWGHMKDRGFEIDIPKAGRVSRRTALRVLGLGAAAGVVAISGLLPGSGARSERLGQPGAVTVSGWAAQRGERYFIAHRGAGDVYPEHSKEAYQAAFAWGAPCLEISVGMTSDGVLICMHDATYDRTTNLTGRLIDQPSSVLTDGRIVVPRLGDYWVRNAPPIPLFEDVIREFGARVVLAIEAKADRAYEPMMRMVERYGLNESVIVKSHFTSKRWVSAQLSGFPVFCYFGTAFETTASGVVAIAARLDPGRDCLVIPGFRQDGTFLDNELVEAAVATGVPVWVYPLHRRSDAAHFFEQGAEGAVCSSYGYIAGAVSAVGSDNWAAQAVAPGDMSKDPASSSYAPKFSTDGELILDAKGTQHFVTLGQMAPLVTGVDNYTIDVDALWRVLPESLSDNLTIAFACRDDSYYQHGGGNGDGYHVTLCADGELGLYRHRSGEPVGQQLTPPVSTPALKIDQAAHLRITVTGSRIVVARTDSGDELSTSDSTVRGDYIHVGRSSLNAVATFRGMSIS